MFPKHSSNLYVGKPFSSVTRHPSQLSLAILAWLYTMNTCKS